MKNPAIYFMAALCSLLASVALAQPSFNDYKSQYSPHNKLAAPDNKAVLVMGYLDNDQAAGIMEEYVKDKNKKTFSIIITSVAREKAGAILDNMKKKYAAAGLNFLNAEWYQDLVYYVSKKTYDAVAADLPAIKKMKSGSKTATVASNKSKNSAYSKFKNSYNPHDELASPDNKAVKVVGLMEAEQVAGIMEEYVKDNDKETFAVIITSIERQKAGKVLDNMNPKMALKGLGFLNEKWSKDLLWYVSETTFNALAANN